MSDKKENIDKFVKKAVEHYDVQYDEAHWEMMEKRLDEEMPIGALPHTGLDIKTILISGLSGMGIMLGILWMGGTFDDSISEDLVVNQVPQGIDITDQVSKENNVPAKPRPDKAIKEELIGSHEMTKTEGKESSVVLVDEIEETPYHGELKTHKKGVSFSHVSMNLESDLAYRTEGLRLVLPEVNEEAKKKTEPNENIMQWGLAASFAPDFNSVGMDSKREFSGQIGMQVFVTLKSRFSVSTGILYNKKKYTTGGEAYHPPDQYWNYYTNGVVPEEVFGHCAVLDIPLNLTYNWSPNRKLQFLSTIGASNYIVLSEDYKYRFDAYNPGAAEGWDTNESTKVMFGIANLSLGVQYFIKPKIGIKVEPYLKVPLKDIGWGQVDLYSTGTLISLQYLFD